MTTYDNGPQLEGWQVTPKHCGVLCAERVCPVCREYLPIPANVVLADN